MIPGNHDQWNKEMWGIEFPFAKDIPILNSLPIQFWPKGWCENIEELQFPTSQWPTLIESSNKSFRLDIFGIDSNSGFEVNGKNLFARGKFSEEAIEKLKADISSTPDGTPTLRCLLCHHSLCYSEEASGPSFLDGIRPKVLKANSRQLLLDIAQDKEKPIHVFLTGHTHSFASRRVVEASEFPKELRCGTTLQASATDGHQGFWAHEITSCGSQFKWESYRYQYDGVGFNRQKKAEPMFHFSVPFATES